VIRPEVGGWWRKVMQELQRQSLEIDHVMLAILLGNPKETGSIGLRFRQKVTIGGQL
jgi:hypothetical protein